MNEITTKICNKCKIEQPVDQFFKDERYKDGYMGTCRTCGRERARKYREEHPEYRLKRNQKTIQWQQKQKLLQQADSILGGWHITIPNYVKKGEYKFNSVSTRGEIFRTNTYTEFLDWVQQLCNK